MIFKQCQDKREWDNYIIDHNGHPLQLWGWGDLKSSHNWGVRRLFLYDTEEKVIGAVQLLIRKLPWPFKSFAYIPRGPVVNKSNREELLIELAKYVKKTYNSTAVTIEPDDEEYITPRGWKKSKNYILPSRTIILNLTKSESELLNDMAKKTRQYIRKSASESIVIETVRNREELDACLLVYKETAKRAKFDIHNDQYYYDVFDKLGDHSLIFVAYNNNQPICFLWLAISASTAFELYGGMNETGQQLRTNYALKWHAIRKCKEWGITKYDFGGLIDGGITTFKKNWAENETNLAGTFDRPLSIFYGIWSYVLPLVKKVVRLIKGIFKF